MNAGNGLDRATRRRVANNTPTGSGLGTAEDTLANVIGEAVALHLAKLLGQIMPQLRQPVACVYCAARAKIAEAVHTQAVADAEREHEIACKAAAELGDTAPEFTPPQPVPVPIQEAFTWVPVVVAKGYPPCAVPVCFDDLPDRPADFSPEPAKPAFREVGLIDPVHGRPIFAPNS